NGVVYSIYVQTPQYKMDSMNSLENTPVAPAASLGLATASNTQLLSNLATTTRGVSPTNITHYNIAPAYDVLMGVQGSDLGAAADRIRAVVAKFQETAPRGTQIHVRGQVQSMHDSFTGLAVGLVFAIVLVY